MQTVSHFFRELRSRGVFGTAAIYMVAAWVLGPTYALAGRAEDALRVAAEMSVDPGPKDRLHLAFTYAALGDYDEAMNWFEICYETRVDWLPWIALEQGYGGILIEIRTDPRFQDLIEKLNLSNLTTSINETRQRCVR